MKQRLNRLLNHRAIKRMGHARMFRLSLALLFLWTLFLPIANIISDYHSYALSSAVEKVIGEANPNLSAKFSYDAAHGQWQFNKDSITTKSNSIDGQQGAQGAIAALQQHNSKAQVGGGGENNQSLYSANLPVKAGEGVNYFDNNTQLSFSMTPLFDLHNGKKWQGRIVYPFADGGKLVYTAKNNGLKEDIVLDHYLTDSLSFSYKLDLPDTLEARLNNDGSIGVYSADPALFGDISYGADSDMAKIMDARKNANKNHLVFALPAPVIKDQNGRDGNVVYSLHDNILKVAATGLGQLNYPLSVDPSVVVTSSSDFTSGNNEGNIDFNSGGVSRGGLTGGSTGAWQTTTSFTTARAYHTSVVYNGYLYVIGGNGDSGYLSDVQYVPINANGTLGSWQTTTSLTTARYDHTSVVYNGYLYVIGGNGGSGYLSDVQYAPINANGTLGSWQTTTSLTTARGNHTSVVYNGYLYVIGGAVGGFGGGQLNGVKYAPINANGTLGSWQTTTSFATARENHTSVVYNGYLYVIGGAGGGFSFNKFNDVQYAPINANGTLGSWQTTTSFATARYDHTSVVYNGYLYVIGGFGDSELNDVQYAPINANGTLGSWQTTTSFTTARAYHTSVVYSGYLYVMGGNGSGSYLNDAQYSKIDPPGVTTDFTANSLTVFGHDTECIAYNGYLYKVSTSSFDFQYAQINSDGTLGSWNDMANTVNPSDGFSLAVYNNYMYISGGYFSGYKDAVYYAQINSDGTVGSWSTTTSLPSGRYNHASVAYGGYLYVTGGYDGSYIDRALYAQINSDGTLGTWSTTTNLPSGRHGHASVAYGGYLYVTGGYSSGRIDEVLYAQINSDGTVGSWQSTTSLPTVRRFHASVVYKGYLYVIGGEEAYDSVLNDVQYAQINDDGTIGSWQATTSLNTARKKHDATVYNGYLYVIGGEDVSSNNVSDIEYARINNGGSGALSAIGGGGTSTNHEHYLGSSVVYDGYLYVLGGRDETLSELDDIEYAPIADDGTIGTWSQTSYNLNNPGTGRLLFAASVYNGYMYVLGGVSLNGGTYYKDIKYAPIGSTGDLTADWTSAASNPSNGGQGNGFAMYEDYAYVLGGWDGFADYNTVQYAPINSNGTLGSWSSTTSFTNGRSEAQAIAYNGYMYFMGGDGAADYNTVQYAPINSNGTLGSWQYTTTFSLPREDFIATTYNGYMYIIGGTNRGYTVNYHDVQYAPINSNGTLGDWKRNNLPGSDAPHGQMFYSTKLTYRGRIYFGGGQNSGGFSNNGISLEISNIPYVGQYSKLIDFGTDQTQISSINYTGNLPGGLSAINYRLAGSDGIFGPLKSAADGFSGGGSGSSCGTGGGGSQYIELFISLDDSQTTVYADTTSSPSEISDITVNYSANTGHPLPSLRLHGGKWFESGTLHALDTCGP